MDARALFDALRTGWLRILVGLVVGLLLAAAVTWTSPTLYASSTRLFVSASGAADTSAAYEGDLLSQQRVASYAELLTGEALAGQVVRELDLPMSAAELASKVAARAVPETVLIEVTVTDTSARRARDIVATLSDLFALRMADLEAPAADEGPSIRVSVAEPAAVPTAPVSPVVGRNLAIGGTLGLLVGFGLALLRVRLDRTVTNGRQIRESSGQPLLGAVPEDPRFDAEHVLTGTGGDAPALTGERIRAIRTSLQFLDVDAPPRVIVVTSAVPDEGKTTLAVNLATALDQAGRRVVLVEADLRRPRVTSYMDLVDGVGLTNVLAGTVALDDVVQRWGEGGLTVIAAGPMPAHPSELLGSAQMRELLAVLRETYDYVVLDSPPLLPVTDAALLGALADGCIITARYGVTRREQLADAADTLDRVGARLLGVVLNRVPRSAVGLRGYGEDYRADPDRTVRVPAALGRLLPAQRAGSR